MSEFVEKVFKFLASIKLAIFVILSLGIISAVGTIVEARYDASYAQKMVYNSPYMYFIMGLLVVNLVNVIIDRYPWQRHHLGFILAHIGIIILIVGSVVTKYYGVDGSVAIDIEKSNRFVLMPETEFVVYGSFNPGEYKVIDSQNVDFIMNRPDPLSFEVPVGNSKLIVKKYLPFALRDTKVQPVQTPDAGPGLRIQIQNANVNMTQWLVRPQRMPYESFALGPANLVLAAPGAQYPYAGGNVLILRPTKNNTEKNQDETYVDYQIYTASQGGLVKKGRSQVGDVIATGWMNLEVRLLKYLPKADYKTEYLEKERPTEMTTQALRVEFNGEESWLGLNTNLKLFQDSTLFVVAFRNRVLDLGFDIFLNKFEVGRYQGTRRAMSYQSLVTVNGEQNLISMNNPLKHNGYTLYQASFQEDPNTGQPITSILSVNRDPGRWVKYLGSLLIVLGTIVMFYFKHYRIKLMGKMTTTGSES